MFCQFCGSNLSEAGRFCPNCGKPIRPLTETVEREKLNEEKDLFVQPVKDTVAKKEGKEKLKRATLLGFISAGLATVAILLLFFLPLFAVEYGETIDGEWVKHEKTFSLFDYCCLWGKELFVAGESEYLPLVGLEFLMVLLVASYGAFIAVSACKKMIKHAKNYFGFENYYQSQRKQIAASSADATKMQELVKQMQKRKNGFWYNFFIDIALMVWVCDFDRIIAVAAGVILVLIIISFILEKISEKQIKKVKERLWSETHDENPQ